MCGIAGFLTTTHSSPPEALLRRLNDAIRHRGPDDSGYYSDAHLSMGMRRLSIIDVAGGHQPIPNEDESVWIVFNGEIFNHAEVRPALERAGHRYRTRSDTETVLHAYEEYGEHCVDHLRGMFAFAIWDRNRRTLFCARDRLGIKPFYYWWDGSLLVFGSEIKALLEHPAITPAFEDSLLPEYLAFGYASGEQTLFRGIKKLMPGHFLRIRLQGSCASMGPTAPFGHGSVPGPVQARELPSRDWKERSCSARPALELSRYWDAPRPAEFETRQDDAWIAECRQRLEETVRMRLMSDVPLGLFLSGGVDSSAITALTKQMVTGPVKTFAVGYREARFSELAYAARVARHIGTEHHEILVGMDDFFQALPRLIWHEDEPITWPSSVSLYFVSRLASEQVKVVLTGEGSDELFGGYERYRHHAFNQRWGRWWRLLPGGMRRLIRDRAADSSLLSASLRRKIRHTFVGRSEDLESLYLDNFYCAFSRQDQTALRGADPGLAPYAGYRSYWDTAAGDEPLLTRLLYADQKTYLVELLMKQDQMSMACSIESRVPFLDHPLVEFAAGVPDHMKIRHGEQKYILKKAVEGLLPDDIIYRKKMGFPTPLRDWFRAPAADNLFSLLRAPDGLLASYVDRTGLDSLIARQKSGFEDATDRLWRLLNLQVWGEMFLTGRRERYWDGLGVAEPVQSAP